MYTTCVIWLAFVPLYFGTANHVPLRITSMSVTISLSASVTLACLFSPKVCIISFVHINYFIVYFRLSSYVNKKSLLKTVKLIFLLYMNKFNTKKILSNPNAAFSYYNN